MLELEIIRYSIELRHKLDDFLDCIIVATAISLRENLVTEDRKIHDLSEYLFEKYGIKILSFYDLIKD